MITSDDLLLKQDFDLYNNIAVVGDCPGRLQARLDIHPAPRILWDFEVLGENPCVPEDDWQHTVTDMISGYDFVLDDVHGIISKVHGAATSIKGYIITGSAAEARFGEQSTGWDSFRFFLPNAKCLVECVEGSLHYAEYHIVYEKGQKPSLEGLAPRRSGIGGGWHCTIEGGWKLYIYLGDDGKEWVKGANNQGTLLTASGTLYMDHQLDGRSSSQKINMFDARERLEILSYLLSFANGGYLGPIVLQATHIENQEVKESLLVSSYETTPLESLGATWLSVGTNLCSYISCLPTFENMLKDDVWEEAFASILSWYFQAIQPTSIQIKGKHWQVPANALGAALERLSVTILQHEKGIKLGNKLKDKINGLLSEIGVLESGDGDEEMIDIFVDSRNDATHPRQEKRHSPEDMIASLQYAKLWVEEAMLWRLGYDGAYRNRIPGSHSFAIDEPRYDLRKRKPDW